jgi:hypothetical protein
MGVGQGMFAMAALARWWLKQLKALHCYKGKYSFLAL